MKVKNFLFVTFFLSTASLGLALPSAPKNVTIPSSPAKTSKTSDVAKTSDVSQVQSVFINAADAAGGVSKECTASIIAIVSSPEFLKCVGAALLPLVPLISDPTILPKFLADPVGNYVKTVEKPLVQFATVLCSEPKCSDDAVAGAIKLLQQGCQKDLESNQLIQLLFDVTVFYSPLRDVTCFKDKDQFCFDESILTITKLPKSPFKITGNDALDSIAVADPTDICTKCNKDIVNTVFNFLSTKNNQLALDILKKLGIDDKKIQEFKIGVAVKCGIKFEDGTIPKEL